MTTRDRKAILTGVGVLAAALLLWFGLLPWIDNWTDTRQNIAASQKQLELMRQQTQRLNDLDRRLEAVYGTAEKKPLVGEEAARTQLINSVMELHGQAGVQVRSVQPQAARPVKELPGVARVSAEVQGTCQAMQLVKLLAAARTSASVLLIDRLESTSGTQGPGGNPGANPGAGGNPGALNVTIVWSTLARQEKAR